MLCLCWLDGWLFFLIYSVSAHRNVTSLCFDFYFLSRDGCTGTRSVFRTLFNRALRLLCELVCQVLLCCVASSVGLGVVVTVSASSCWTVNALWLLFLSTGILNGVLRLWGRQLGLHKSSNKAIKQSSLSLIAAFFSQNAGTT